MKTLQQAVDNWSAAMGSAETANKYKQGIANTTENPMALAATDTAMQNYLNGVQRSVTSGKRVAKLQAASFSDWKTTATTIGVQNLANGAKKGKPKMQRGLAAYAAAWPQMRAAARALPKGGKSNAMNRISAALDVIYSISGTGT
jgi:hypothetical protein